VSPDLRRLVLAAAGLFAGLTLLLSLKSAPGAIRAPEQARAQPRTPTPEKPPTTQPPTAEPPTAAPGMTAAPGVTPTPLASPVSGFTYTGDSAYTEFGYVTVQITVANGRIIDVVAVELPGDEARSVTLSARVGPILRERALAAQGADFDTVSGATWTSEAYQQSLRSALAKAGRT
jgi:uncharacterized protein with FMN-binding domain